MGSAVRAKEGAGGWEESDLKLLSGLAKRTWKPPKLLKAQEMPLSVGVSRTDKGCQDGTCPCFQRRQQKSPALPHNPEMGTFQAEGAQPLLC